VGGEVPVEKAALAEDIAARAAERDVPVLAGLPGLTTL